MIQPILYAYEDVELCEESAVKDSLTTQTDGENEVLGDTPADQFRGVAKLIVLGKGSRLDINGEVTQ